jgi:hypothetical protein
VTPADALVLAAIVLVTVAAIGGPAGMIDRRRGLFALGSLIASVAALVVR